MEHRQNRRIEANFGVTIRYRGRLISGCSARNISMNGMFVEISTAAPERNSLVEVEFNLNINSQKITRKVLSSVVHTRPEGMGVMFVEDLRLYPFNTLENLVQAA